MSDTERPKITFPCPNYPIKIMGNAEEHFADKVLEIVEKHCNELNRNETNVKDSKNGRFLSVTVYITAESEDHLKALFNDLKTYKAVQIVL